MPLQQCQLEFNVDKGCHVYGVACATVLARGAWASESSYIVLRKPCVLFAKQGILISLTNTWTGQVGESVNVWSLV